MILKLLSSVFLTCALQIVHAQERIGLTQNLKNRKIGIYQYYDEFVQNHPGILKPFKVVYKVTVDKETHDTLQKGLTYQFLDSSRTDREVWGLFDGEKVYFHVNRDLFSPVNYVGRYTFLLLDDRDRAGFRFPFYSVLTATSVLELLAIPAEDALAKAISPIKKKLYYYNEKGKLIEATSQSIGWLIRKDKDLVKEMHDEKNLNINTFIKYLVKMNERYPL